LAHQHGIKVLVDVDMLGPDYNKARAERVNNFKTHPAVLGWYASDEKGLNYLPYLKESYKTYTDLDPDHPVWSVFTVGQVVC
jgi:endo-1,4-beta-mannosidase